MTSLHSTTPKVISTILLFIIFIIGNKSPVYGIENTVLKGTEEGISLIRCDRRGMVLEYDAQKDTTPKASHYLYLAVYPSGPNTPQVTEYTFEVTNADGTLREVHSGDTDAPPLTQPQIMNVASLAIYGFVRDYRIGRFTINLPARFTLSGDKVLTGRITHMRIEISNPTTDDIVLSDPERKKIGMENVLGDMVFNYAFADALRGKAVLPSGKDNSNYPGLPAPDFYKTGQTWIKLSVTQSGMHKVTFTDLLKQDISPSVIDPRTFRIFCQGKEIPLDILGPKQDYFIPENAVVFYGEPLKNIYSETGAYWLTWGGETGLRIPRVEPPLLSSSTNRSGVAGVDNYVATVRLQEKHEYEFSVTPPQPSHWFWKTLSGGEFSAYTVTLANLVENTRVPQPDLENGHPIQMTFNGMTLGEDQWKEKNLLDLVTTLPPQGMKQGKNQIQFNFTASMAPDTETIFTNPENFGKVRIGFYGKGEIAGGHTVQVTLNGTPIGSTQWAGSGYCEFSTTVSTQVLKEGGNQVGITLLVNTTGEDAIYLDFVELSYPRQIRIGKGTEEITAQNLLDNTTTHRVYISSQGKPLRTPVIFYLDPSRNVSRVEPLFNEKSKKFYFDLSTADRYCIGDLASMEPVSVQKEPVADNLRSPDNQADVIYITHPDFLPAVKKLSDYRKSQGFSTHIVNVYDIYDQFNGGNFDPRAIRKFLQYSFYYWRSPSPNYIVLVGDANWDYMDYQETGTKTFIPSYRSPDQEIIDEDAGSMEDFYVQVNEHDSYPGMVLGRISVETLKDAQAVVEKTIAQETGSELGTWRTTSIVAADDGFESDAEESIHNYLPLWMTPDILHLQDYPYMDHQKFGKASRRKQSPEATTALLEKMDRSSPFMLYVGHGGGGVWSHTRLFVAGSGVRTSDTYRLHNPNRNLFIYTMSCLNGYFDYPNPPWQSISAEVMEQYPDRGSIAMLVPTGKGGTGQHLQLGQGLAQAFFRDHVRTIGDAVYQAKLLYLFTTSDFGLSQMYLILGDPMAQDALPKGSLHLDIVPKSILPARENHLRVSGSTETDFKDGFATLGVYSEDSAQPLIEKSGVPFTGGKFMVDLSLPPSDKKLILRAYAWNEQSRMDAAGALAIPLQTSVLQFTFASQTTLGDTTFLQLKNLLPEPVQSGEVKLLLKNSVQTKFSLTQKIQGPLDPQQENSFPLPSAVSPGVYDAEIQFAGQISPDQFGQISRETTFPLVMEEPQAVPAYQLFSKPDSHAQTRPLGIAESEVSIHPREISSGDTLTVTLLLHNYGRTTIENIPYEGTLDGVALTTTLWIPFISPLATDTLQIPWTVPSTYLSKSQKERKAVFRAVFDNQVRVTREIPIRQLPLLTLTRKDIKITPVKPEDGGTIFFDMTVHNNGQLPARRITVSGYDGDPDKGGKEITNIASVPTPYIDLVNPGESKSLRLRWDPPVKAAGQHQIYLIVDRQKQIRESDRSNQQVVLPLRIYASADLAIRQSDITWTPQQPFAGETILISAVIHNLGETDALTAYPWGEHQSHAFDIKFHYRSSNGVESSIGTLYVPILPAGRSTTLQMPVVATPDMASILVKVDAENEVLEIEEYANNVAGKTIFVKPR